MKTTDESHPETGSVNFSLQLSQIIGALLLELLGLLELLELLYFVPTGSNSGTIVIAGQSTNPLSVSLISGITDKGSKLKPI